MQLDRVIPGEEHVSAEGVRYTSGIFWLFFMKSPDIHFGPVNCV